MSTSLLALRAKPRLVLPTVHQTVRNAGTVKGPPKDQNVSDPKVETIRRALYPSNLRNRESPTGAWRPSVGRRLQRAIPSVQAHETIERAWRLHKRHIRRGREAEIERKFNCMKEAMETLRELDTKLYAEANKEEDPRKRSDAELEILKNVKGTQKRALESRIRGLFPRELRVPTDTPPANGWNYNWKPVIRPLA
jgi:large subunit ribosomal protein L40